jgi:hypothetical protein
VHKLSFSYNFILVRDGSGGKGNGRGKIEGKGKKARSGGNSAKGGKSDARCLVLKYLFQFLKISMHLSSR